MVYLAPAKRERILRPGDAVEDGNLAAVRIVRAVRGGVARVVGAVVAGALRVAVGGAGTGAIVGHSDH